MFLHGFGHISLNFHTICLIVGSFLSRLVGYIYGKVIITGLDRFKTGFDKDQSRPVFCGFLWFFEVVGHWGTGSGLSPLKNSKKTGPQSTTLSWSLSNCQKIFKIICSCLYFYYGMMGSHHLLSYSHGATLSFIYFSIIPFCIYK